MGAVVPLLWRWESPSAEDWQDAHDSPDGHEQVATFVPPTGASESSRYWLSLRRERWLHEQQVRG